MFVLPQVLVGRYEPILDSNGFANGEICRIGGNATSEFCFGQYGGEWYHMFIFFLGQLLMGAGTTPVFTLGPAYIDENVHPKSSPVYLAVFFALTLLGPGLGFIGGGSLLNIYIDITPVSLILECYESRVETLSRKTRLRSVTEKLTKQQQPYQRVKKASTERCFDDL